MFTKNWYKLVAVCMAGTTGLDTYKSIDGKSRDICSQPSLIRYGYNADGNSVPCISFSFSLITLLVTTPLLPLKVAKSYFADLMLNSFDNS